MTSENARRSSPIVLEGVNKTFPNGVVAVQDVRLSIEPGEFMVLVGPSGCGKTTILRMIAGLEDVTHGAIRIGDRDVTKLSPRDRDIAMVFQSYALYPHMTVRKNLGYALRARRTPKAEITARVAEVARLLGLEDLLERRPAELSGGQRQRVAMGRAMVREPQVFLMDEPLSNLDAKLRVVMRAELARLHERLGVTTVYVTHDQVEAMTLGDRVAVMNGGQIEQLATPADLYAHPETVFVASFMGSPSMNLVAATVKDGYVEFGEHRCRLDRSRQPRAGAVVLGIRPHDIADARLSDQTQTTILVRPTVVELLGAEVDILFEVAATSDASLDSRFRAPRDRLIVDENITFFTARLDSRTQAVQGESLELAFDPSSFHFFDPETGENLLPRALAPRPVAGAVL